MLNPASLANLRPKWDSETARLVGIRGNQSPKRRPKITDNPPPESGEPPPDMFNSKRLLRVRKQLTRLDDLMDHEIDPQKLDRLASAQARLSEQERILRGEPLPGSRRPAPERKSSRGQSSQGHSAGSFHASPTPQPVASHPPIKPNGA